MKARLVGIAVVAATVLHLVSVALSEQLAVLTTSSMDEPSVVETQRRYQDNRTLTPNRLKEIRQIYESNNARNNLTLDESEYFFPDSPLNDKTLPWDSSIRRVWQSSFSGSKSPPAMMLLTNIGWNQENQSTGSQIYRGVRLRELADGVINHEWFHPTAYQDLNEGRMPISNTTQYYVFIDRDTCGEKNFPKYGRGEFVNADRAGRGDCCRATSLQLDSIMNSRLLREAPNAKVVVWECGGNGPLVVYRKARQIYGEKLSLVSISASAEQMRPGLDQGLPPPVVNPCNLTLAERQQIEDCDETDKDVLVSFSGMMRWTARNSLMKLHNGEDILVFRGKKREIMQHYNMTDFGLAYHKLFKSSLFGACPRGDNLFSYRFTEQMSCGTIPVVYADDWTFPFDFALVDWEDAVVLIREEDAPRTPEILRAIPRNERCAMRRKALDLYDKYLSDGRSVVRGVIETFELQRSWKPAYTTSDEDKGRISPEIYTTCPPQSNRLNSPMLDKTLCWDSTVNRQWLENASKPHPPAMLLLTQFGWSHAKPKQRVRHSRTLRSRELTEGVINHPWFSPQPFNKIFNSNGPIYANVTYYIFLDIETCGEANYPFYQRGQEANKDTFGGRKVHSKYGTQVSSIWSQLSQLSTNISWKVIYWDCESYGPTKNADRLGGRTIIASTSARKTQDTPESDQGIPLPPYRRFVLSPSQRKSAESCAHRPILLYYSGGLLSRPRRLLQRLHNGNDIMVGTPDDVKAWRNRSDSYFDHAVESSFCAVPRSRILGSSRLIEMMSTGCIPVILADGWLLPLQLTIKWSDIAVIIPELEVLQTAEILRNVTKEAQCEMRKRMLHVYDKYLSTGSGIVAGLVEGLENTRLANDVHIPEPPVGYTCITLESGASECKKAS